MKEIKKEVKKEIIETITIYQAADGSEFNDAEECKKYENSAAGMLMCKVSDFSFGEVDNPMDEGSENIYKLIIPITQEQLDTLNHLHKLFGGRNLDTLFFTSDNLNRPILMGYRTYNNEIDWCWFYRLDNIVKDLTQDKFILMPKP
jgi:hypothetical protein